MTIDLLDRSRLELLNKNGPKYHLQDAEKDYFLAIILSILYSSEFKGALVFKGGTAIYHCYLEQLRFSKDLDFTANAKLNAADLERLFSKFEIFGLKDMKEKRYSLEFSLQYRGPLSQADTIELDINTNQRVLSAPRMTGYRNFYGIELACLVMDIREIAAEKIRTLLERARPRDPYDLIILKKKNGIKMKDALALLRKKELHQPLDKKRIEENLAISLERFDEEMKELYYREPIKKEEIEALRDELLKMID